MTRNSQTRKLQKELLVAQGAVRRQKIQISIDAMRCDLQIGTNRTHAASGLIGLFAVAANAASLPAILGSLVGDSRLARWLVQIRRTLRLSQLAVDIFRMLSPPRSEQTGTTIVRERTDATASDR